MLFAVFFTGKELAAAKRSFACRFCAIIPLGVVVAFVDMAAQLTLGSMPGCASGTLEWESVVLAVVAEERGHGQRW